MRRRDFVMTIPAAVAALAISPSMAASKAADGEYPLDRYGIPIRTADELKGAITSLYPTWTWMEPRAYQEFDGYRVIPTTYALPYEITSAEQTAEAERQLLWAMYRMMVEVAHENLGSLVVWRAAPKFVEEPSVLRLRLRLGHAPLEKMKDCHVQGIKFEGSHEMAEMVHKVALRPY